MALVALMLITAFFWVYQLRPFMRRAKQEARRVAELLSQLPPEMAVEELVQVGFEAGAAVVVWCCGWVGDGTAAEPSSRAILR